ncbi:hypothetical protein DRF65_21615 [Chryseobacterium pennae]|uniref:Uncharacterized protein n=2 Tax=Chryseobacterium group TaxID=2782232 RepID=A0A3D9C3H4_9FLAO|nr:hypothetical protein DRF65_21615 [Chryseobacterium pennae]
MSFYLCISSYYKVKESKDVDVWVLKDIVKFSNRNLHPYFVFTGINTGYGFFGTSVSTQKFIEMERYDINNKLLESSDNFGFTTVTGRIRYEGFPTHISNFISETEEMAAKDSTQKKSKDIKLREDYAYKLFKHLGKRAVGNDTNTQYYIIRLCTIIPHDIWQGQITKNKVYVEKEYKYYIK